MRLVFSAEGEARASGLSSIFVSHHPLFPAELTKTLRIGVFVAIMYECSLEIDVVFRRL
jgi:hypothetical protein